MRSYEDEDQQEISTDHRIRLVSTGQGLRAQFPSGGSEASSGLGIEACGLRLAACGLRAVD